MNKADRKRLKKHGKELVNRRSQELRAALDADYPWPVGSPQWIERYKELNQLQQQGVARRRKLYPIPAWAARGRILSHFYIAHPPMAAEYDRSPESFSERTELSRITPSELTGLWAIMRGGEWDESLVDGFDVVLPDDGGRRLVYRLPADMVHTFATVTSGEITSLTEKWAEREHFAWRRDATKRVIQELVRLASRATISHQNLYLWICY